MPISEIKQRIEAAVKDAMRARDKQRLGVLRLTMAEFKRIEVDERIELDDERVLAVLDKMTKQRIDSLTQFDKAGRDDLAAQEAFEIALIKEFLPEPLSEAEITQLIDAAIETAGASSMQAMGQVMALLRPQMQGRADIGKVSGLVKGRLS
ncbi:GatB/YqeY domain-containing protein [Pseudomonadales bacterium]|nr:GatB/YqeY domain-containing protein [Pseudomonadales bacterium]MDA9064260.1 GatB/YqeY domain-containing protein [Pseudomonadales bacterium]MDA9315888.1 GatB/YqeY domain-containing protein [Pseudomonadales bacterium]MDB9867921.1 GatB/YqeY domain-containing protein [Pseudomonadales bacterium]MDB9918077.1 GatB/YqeY domain-containing protein [Pseudomonadales bacterium]|tara:strand:+ start:150 stop:602 length:453 start_codon:yes stop_codon:yes gene_type:complete